MKYFSHLNTAALVINEYDGKVPFHLFIKDFFKQERKYGSRDRRNISNLCYCCFRTGRSMMQLPLQDRIVASLFLCSDEPNEVLEQLEPKWNTRTRLPVPEKWKLLRSQYEELEEVLSTTIFPVQVGEFSAAVNTDEFVFSHFTQPDFFIRIRPGQSSNVISKLSEAGIPYEQADADSLRLPNGARVDELFEPEKEMVVQDLNSQRTGRIMQQALEEFVAQNIPEEELTIWDCCTGSGGKSLLAHDLAPEAVLTVTDIRDNILTNLRNRFGRAGIRNYESFVWDLQRGSPDMEPFHLVIADVPCTGSGTWGRNPEHLVYFSPSEIERYSNMQKRIVSNAAPLLAPNGYLVYITCSIFKKENEDVVTHVQQQTGLKLVRMELLAGYALRADSMFVALLKRA